LRRKELRILLVVCLGTFFHIQSVGSISISLSAIQKEFGATLAAVQWIGLMGAIMLSSLSLCFGRAGDLVGRRTIFKMGLALYTAGAGLAAVAGSFPQLLAFRFIMALGVAMAAPLAGAIIASIHGPESRGQALGWLAASIALGRTTGPTIGGLILHLWGWRAVFLANCIFGIATCLTLFMVLKGREERREVSFDFLGVVSLVIGFPSFLIALSLGPRLGWDASEIALWLGLAAGGMASFVWRELHAEAPLMNLSYLKSIPLVRSMLALVLATLAFYPVSIFGPLYMLNVIRASPLLSGFAMATLPLCTTLLSPLSGRLADRSAGVGAERDRRHPGGDGDGRPAARSAGRSRRVVGVACGPERRVLVGDAEGKLVQVGLAHEHGAGGAQPGDDARVPQRAVPDAHARRRGRRDSLGAAGSDTARLERGHNRIFRG